MGKVAKKKRRRRVVAPRLEDYVEKLLGGMMSYGEIVDHAIEEFECHEATVARAIANVKARWRESAGASVDERRAKFLGELEHAWRQALSASDYRAVAVMARTRADVEGIKAPKKIDHGGTIGLRPVAALSPQEREREIQVLLAKRQAALTSGAGVPAIPTDPSLEGATAPAELEAPATSKPRRTKSKKPQVH